MCSKEKSIWHMIRSSVYIQCLDTFIMFHFKLWQRDNRCKVIFVRYFHNSNLALICRTVSTALSSACIQVGLCYCGDAIVMLLTKTRTDQTALCYPFIFYHLCAIYYLNFSCHRSCYVRGRVLYQGWLQKKETNLFVSFFALCVHLVYFELMLF